MTVAADVSPLHLPRRTEIRADSHRLTRDEHRAAIAAAYGFPADFTDDQILERLLALNLERAAEEAKAAKVKKPKAQRAKSAQELI